MLRFGGIRDNLSNNRHDMQPLVAQYSLSDWMKNTACEGQCVTHSWGPWPLSSHKGIFLRTFACIIVSLESSLSVQLIHPSPGIFQYQCDTLQVSPHCITWSKGEAPQIP